MDRLNYLMGISDLAHLDATSSLSTIEELSDLSRSTGYTHGLDHALHLCTQIDPNTLQRENQINWFQIKGNIFGFKRELQQNDPEAKWAWSQNEIESYSFRMPGQATAFYYGYSKMQVLRDQT